MPSVNQPTITIAQYPVWSIWSLVLLVFATHGMLLLNDGVYWDGWTLYGYYLNHDVDSLLGTFRDAGNPWTGYIHWAFWFTPDMVFTYRLVTFLCLMLSTLLIYVIVQRISILSVLERWFIAAIFCCYSAYQANVEFIMTPARISYAIFLLGIYVVLRAIETQGKVALLLRVLALVIIGFSFRLNSLLVFYFPFLVLFLMSRSQEWEGEDWRGKFVALLRYGDFILLPFVCWIAARLLWERKREYSEYNQLIFDPKQWVVDFWQSIDNAIINPFIKVLNLAAHRPVLALFVCLLVIVLERLYAKKYGRKEPQAFNIGNKSRNATDIFKVAGFAVFMLVCALFPYIVVGKFPSTEGWDSRHALLLNLPMAIGLVAVGRLLGLMPGFRLAPRALRVFAGILVLAFMLVTCKVYLEWQVRWIKDSSFIVNLQKLPKAETDKIDIYLMNDAYPVGYDFYRFYEYVAMFKMAWGVESKIGFHPSAGHDAEWVLKNVALRRTLLKDFHAGGCQGMLTIRAKHPEVSRIRQMVTYLKYRWFQQAGLTAFLSDFTTLELTDVVCPAPRSEVPKQ